MLDQIEYLIVWFDCVDLSIQSHFIQWKITLGLSSSEPDSPPVNLTVVDTSPSTTTLAWSAPEQANGMIQHYEVLYENESFSALMNTSSNTITLMNLKPFSYYTVSVRAYTRYGHGNQTSDALYLLSGEDGVLMDASTHANTHM